MYEPYGPMCPDGGLKTTGAVFSLGKSRFNDGFTRPRNQRPSRSRTTCRGRGTRSKTLSQELRTERDAVDRHETESRLLMIKMRNLEGVASTVHDVVREYHVLEERETRAVSLWEKARHELLLAESAIETARTKPSASSRDSRADPGPGKVIISVENDERRRSESALVADLTRMVEAWRGDRLRARAEADEGVATIQGAEARDKKLQYALDKARRSESMLRDRIREWEAFLAAFIRQGTSYDDGRMGICT